MLAVKIAGYWKYTAHPAEKNVFVQILLFLLREEHFEAGEHQKNAEDVKNPVEGMNKHSAHSDHPSTHKKRSQNPPKQNTVLVACGHGKRGKNHCDDEDIVHAQRFLDDVGGQMFSRGEPPVVHHFVDGIGRMPTVEPVPFVREITQQ